MKCDILFSNENKLNHKSRLRQFLSHPIGSRENSYQKSIIKTAGL